MIEPIEQKFVKHIEQYKLSRFDQHKFQIDDHAFASTKTLNLMTKIWHGQGLKVCRQNEQKKLRVTKHILLSFKSLRFTNHIPTTD